MNSEGLSVHAQIMCKWKSCTKHCCFWIALLTCDCTCNDNTLIHSLATHLNPFMTTTHKKHKKTLISIAHTVPCKKKKNYYVIVTWFILFFFKGVVLFFELLLPSAVTQNSKKEAFIPGVTRHCYYLWNRPIQ